MNVPFFNEVTEAGLAMLDLVPDILLANPDSMGAPEDFVRGGIPTLAVLVEFVVEDLDMVVAGSDSREVPLPAEDDIWTTADVRDAVPFETVLVTNLAVVEVLGTLEELPATVEDRVMLVFVLEVGTTIDVFGDKVVSTAVDDAVDELEDTFLEVKAVYWDLMYSSADMSYSLG